MTKVNNLILVQMTTVVVVYLCGQVITIIVWICVKLFRDVTMEYLVLGNIHEYCQVTVTIL